MILLSALDWLSLHPAATLSVLGSLYLLPAAVILLRWRASRA